MATPPQLSHFLYPDWEPEVRAALTEGDPHKFREKIRLAGLALFNRSQSINPQAYEERSAMAEATIALRLLINKRLHEPQPRSAQASEAEPRASQPK